MTVVRPRVLCLVGLLLASCTDARSPVRAPGWTEDALGGPADAILALDLRALRTDPSLAPLSERAFREAGDRTSELRGASRLDILVRGARAEHFVGVIYDAPARPSPALLADDFGPPATTGGALRYPPSRGGHGWLTVVGTTWILSSEPLRDVPAHPAPVDLPSHAILAMSADRAALGNSRHRVGPGDLGEHLIDASLVLVGGDAPEIRTHARFDDAASTDRAVALLQKQNADDDLGALLLALLGKIEVDRSDRDLDIRLHVRPELIAFVAKQATKRHRHDDD